MKVCPLCQSTYENRVDFCFRDGAPLEASEISADPTSLPDPAAVNTSSIADAPTQVRKKPRRAMFARPSVADMLTVSGSQVRPPPANLAKGRACGSIIFHRVGYEYKCLQSK